MVEIKKVTYTEQVYDRVNKKLGTKLDHATIENLVAEILKDSRSVYREQGKNIYVSHHQQQVRLTINASTYRLITVDRLINDKKR